MGKFEERDYIPTVGNPNTNEIVKRYTVEDDNSAGAGTILSVTGTDVDNTDPTNPIVTSDDAATLAAAKSYADGIVTGLWDDRGNYDASVNTFPASGGSGTAGAIKKGDIWTVSVAGTLGGHAVTAGDTVRALTDTPGQTDGNWAIAENNIGYVHENSANKTTDGTLAANSDTLYPSEKAVKTYADAKVADAINDGVTTIAPSENAVFDALALKAPLASPTLTGTPAAPTAAAGTSTTQIATTAFVQTEIGFFTESYLLQNLGLSVTVAANAVTIALKQADGSTNPASGTGAVKASFRSATATSSLYLVRSVTGALSLTVPSTATLGFLNNVAGYTYFYLIDNAGTLKLGVAKRLFDEGSLITTVAIDTASDSGSVMYSDAAYTNVGFRLIGRAVFTEATAGTWATAPSEVSLLPVGTADDSVIDCQFAPTDDTGFNPADATTYYFSNVPVNPSTGSTARASMAPFDCRIVGAIIEINPTGAGGTSEQSSIYFRLNDTTDTTLTTTYTTNGTAIANCKSITGLNITLVGGVDTYAIKWTTPTWATNPTFVVGSIKLIVERF